MDHNDKILAENKAELILLIDSSAYLSMQDIALNTGIHLLSLLVNYPKVDYYFANAVANELIRGKEGLNANTLNMLKKTLHDEAIGDFNEKDGRTLYRAKDGSIRVASLTSISGVDSSQILLCQNHQQLVLLTNDHKMLKNGAAVLDNRLMDVLNLLELMSETPNPTIRKQWLKTREYYENHSGYKRPKTVRCIPDRLTGEKPPHLR